MSPPVARVYWSWQQPKVVCWHPQPSSCWRHLAATRPIRGEYCGHVTCSPPITAHLEVTPSGQQPSGDSAQLHAPSSGPMRDEYRCHVTSSPPITGHLAAGSLGSSRLGPADSSPRPGARGRARWSWGSSRARHTPRCHTHPRHTRSVSPELSTRSGQDTWRGSPGNTWQE